MNSLGRGVSQAQRTANLPKRVEDRYNPINATNVLNSLTVQPKAPQITNYGVGNPHIHRGKMNDVDYVADGLERELGIRATTIDPRRAKNLLSNYAYLRPTVSNDRNAFTAK
jgi:hypothetical protein